MLNLFRTTLNNETKKNKNKSVFYVEMSPEIGMVLYLFKSN